MSEFDQINLVKFIADYSIKNGVLVDEYVINLPTERLKKEINNMFNVINILNNNRLISWNPVENYIVGELVQNETADDKYYRAKKNSNNKRPDLFPEYWELAKNTDYTKIGDFNNFLAKDNTTAYSPSKPYNPATKGYVDYKDTLKLNIDGKAVDSSLLNGEAVTAVLSNSISKPAAVKLVQSVDNKVNKKLDSSEFTSANILSKIKSVDGSGSGLDADLLDGKSSEEFMKVSDATDFDVTKTPGSYTLGSGSNGAPTGTEAYSLIVYGKGSFVSQMAMSVTNGNFYYRNFVGNWSAWKSFVDSKGNVSTADKLKTQRTISLSGDASGSVYFDGSKNVNIDTTVKNDSHTHDTRYYTKTQGNSRYLEKTGKASDSDKLNGLDSTKFLRSDTGGTVNGNTTFTKDIVIDGNLTVSGTSSKINTVDMTVTDKNIELGAIDVPTDDTANGGGITLLGNTNKSIIWDKTDNKWHFSCGAYIPEISGTVDNANTLTHKKPDVNANANTIVLRDGNGHINGKASDSELLDGYNSSVNSSANTVPVRNGSSDINARLFRSSYQNQSSLASSAAICFRNNTSDNYMRFVTHTGMINWIGKVNDSDKLDGHNSDVNANANTIVLRDGNGNINGTSSSAKYADLAEIYTSKENYKIGTLVQISSSDKYDIEKNINDVFGVISDKPGFILDIGETGLPVAMVGKTPVRIIGKIKKGDKISANGDVGVKAKKGDKIFGIALESKNTSDESLIKCVVKVQL